MKNAFKIASIYIGTVIGAGFASGQEVIKFFAYYGYKGFFGVVIALLLFSIIGTGILLYVHKHKISSHDELLEDIFGIHTAKIINKVVFVLLFSIYCVMLAGSGVLIEEYFHCSMKVGIIIMSMITCIVFICGINGLAIVNMIIVPLIFLGIVMISISVSFTDLVEVGLAVPVMKYNITGNFMTSSLLYVSYNSIGAIIVMSSMGDFIKDKKTAIVGGVLGGVGLGLMLFFLFLPTNMLYATIFDSEIPMITIASYLGEIPKILYSILLWGAMLTTAIANGYVLIQNIEKRIKLHHIVICILFCIITMPLAGFGFKNLINFLYPLFGYVGLFIFILMGYQIIKKRIRI
ncbi:hypothetical protein IZY60_01970 [Lutibacter sp. B2]|nr:hypothetical protein [Lutibacter sp. B2]